MEDDDSDTSLTIDESVTTEKAENHSSATLVRSNTVSECSNSPKLLEGENDESKQVCDDSVIKPLSTRDTAVTPNNKNGDKNVNLLTRDIDIPKSPKKVNGEVKLSKYDKNEQELSVNINISNNGVERNTTSDNATGDKETENVINSGKDKQISSPSIDTKVVKEDGQNSESNAEYKGFKKKIIAQQSIASNNIPGNVPISGSASVGSSKSNTKSKRAASKKNVSTESQHVLVSHQSIPEGTQSSAQLTEYAQYLGLQPTVKFKCFKCGESGFPSMLKLHEHQNICLKNLNKMQSILKPTPPPSSSEPSPSTNFRITRKVYLCSSCGTYYENWNLFLHMREVHKRHICLFCLGMFSQADKLASHLVGKHGVVEGLYASTEHFVGEMKGSCFLMCCTCERMFTERDNFYEHSCSEGLIINAEKACSLCGLRGAHFPTCRRAFTDSNISPPSSSTVSTGLESPSEPMQNSQLAVQEHNTSTNYLIPVSKVPGKKSNKGTSLQENAGESPEKSRELSDVEDDYDISNAASFCHVNIHEPQEKQTSGVTSKVRTYKGKKPEEIAKNVVPENKPSESSPTVKENDKLEKDDEDNNIVEDKKDSETSTEKTVDIISEKKPEEVVSTAEESDKPVTETIDAAESMHDIEEEPSKTDSEDKMDLEEGQCSETKTNDENVDSANKEETETKSESQEETILKPPVSPEPSEKQLPKPDASPKESPQSDTKQTVKTASVTEAESESESSDSGEESDSSSSSDASSEESEHREEAKKEERMEESDADNADSDKMSLIVDENRSDEETEPQLEEEEVNKEGKEEEEEEKENEDIEMKLDEPKSDVEMADNVVDENEENKSVDEEKVEESGESIQLAGDDVPLLELTLEENLETMNIQMLLKESVKVSCINCVYCNHAKKIAVNGKQLALHLLAEHRFAPVVCSDSGELTEADGFVDKLKNSLTELQHMFFNTDSYDNMDVNFMRPYDRTYECFHCHFVTTLHKELYVHNRKMHQKTILLCIMCKSNFYSYSELLCHLCPGIYVPESNIIFHCCLCTVDGLPSAFRLMVHLRKRHHACDVCLETTGDQQKLSNHVWKHKLHHLCYRCGIAYRNKPDITKHLFWKHGTESVLCKKCLQKKWPHVYHFCIPPNAFVCEECNSSFSLAVQLKVHKRLHAGDLPYPCDECEERFISRKLLIKHQDKHRDPPEQIGADTNMQENGPVRETESHEEEAHTSSHEGDKSIEENAASSSNNVGKQEEEQHVSDSMSVIPTSEESKNETHVDASVPESSGEGSKHEEKEINEKKTKVMDVYDLPPLNLSSESDDSDEETEKKEAHVSNRTEKPTVEKENVVSESIKEKSEEKVPQNETQDDGDTQQQIEVVDGIWENFKTYKANLERRENLHLEAEENLLKINESTEQSCSRLSAEVISIINMDHDYCGPIAGSSHLAEEQSASTSKLEGQALSHSLSPLPDAEKTEETKEKTDDEMKACDADHNYCFSNTSISVEDEKEKEQTIDPVSSAVSPSKKKQKSPKKKQKRSASSSSSDSSSNSDSSSCSCGTNCSCSSSSSSSSGSSSSQSSDSDSSSSEGRRRQAARRERRRERARKRKLEDTEETKQLLPPSQSPKLEAPETATNGPPEHEETAPVPSLVEPEETELQIRESDLDTDETETDEDFYDKYPQKLANKLLAEKRNQLLLLAAVAPVNNGTMSQSCQSPPPSSVEEPVPKKKVKTKKHKKSQHQHATTEHKAESKIKLNIPTDYYSTQSPVFSKSTLSTSSASNSINTPSLATPACTTQSPFLTSHPEPSTPTASYQSTGSGSETDTKRLSKRKRVPKRFYGDSSDEEQEQPPVKWRKVSTPASNSPAASSAPPTSFTYKSTPVTVTETFCDPSTPVPINEEKSEEEAADDSDSDHEDARKSSSESSNSESEAEKEQDDDDPSDADSEVETSVMVQTNAVPASREGEAVQQKNENLYCYCQCPYDEVSEMIACDGKDCTIEWFHFECVGIMVPPKGKWFCPDCRKRAAARSEYLLHV